MEEINKIRRKIDKIDAKILELLRERQKNVIRIGEIKNRGKLKIKDKEREMEILSKMEGEYEKGVFKKILSHSRKMQS